MCIEFCNLPLENICNLKTTIHRCKRATMFETNFTHDCCAIISQFLRVHVSIALYIAVRVRHIRAGTALTWNAGKFHVELNFDRCNHSKECSYTSARTLLNLCEGGRKNPRSVLTPQNSSKSKKSINRRETLSDGATRSLEHAWCIIRSDFGFS